MLDWQTCPVESEIIRLVEFKFLLLIGKTIVKDTYKTFYRNVAIKLVCSNFKEYPKVKSLFHFSQ